MIKRRLIKIFQGTMFRGFQVTKNKFKRIDLSKLKKFCEDILIYHDGHPGNFDLKYHEYYTQHNRFLEYLSSKENASLLYRKIQPNHKHVQEYDRELDAILNEVSKNMGPRNEQSHALSLNDMHNKGKGLHGRQLLLANALSVVIRYQDDTLGILRFKFLDEKTSYTDQGKIITMLSAISYSKLCQEHNIVPELNANSFYHPNANVKEVIKTLLSRLEDIEEIILFREPGAGRVFHKREYQFSANDFYLYTMHTGDAVDITRTHLIDSSLKDYNDLLLNEYLTNKHDKFVNKIAYFNFTDFFNHIDVELKEECIDQIIPLEIYGEVLDIINEYYFETVTQQQCRMYLMIKNQVKDAFTDNIKSCHIIKPKFAKNKLSELQNSKVVDQEKIDYVKRWIKELKENPKRIDPGSELLLEMSDKDDRYSQYIMNEFVSSIPWFNSEFTEEYAHKSFRNRLGDDMYQKHKSKLTQIIEQIFGKKGYLYGNKKHSRGVFYQEIALQFEEYAVWEQRKRKGKTIKEQAKISVEDILKDRVLKNVKTIAKEKGLQAD